MSANMHQWPSGLPELGRWLADKWGTRLMESGRDYGAVARQMRKQGFPLEIALALLLRRVAR